MAKDADYNVGGIGYALPVLCTDDDYDKYLRQQMGDCLANAIAEVADKRPKDPIENLAHCLYKSQGKTPPNEDLIQDKSRIFSINYTKSNDKNSTDRRPALLLEPTEDGLEDYEVSTSTMACVRVHEAFTYSFTNIGDLFDSDDIS